MARLGLGTQMLLRGGSCWVKAGPVVAPMGTFAVASLCNSIRQVSTTRPKKSQAVKEAVKEESVPLSKAKAPKASVGPKTKKTSAKAAAASEQATEGAKPAKKAAATKPKSAGSTGTGEKPPATTKKSTAAAASKPTTTTANPAGAAAPSTPSASNKTSQSVMASPAGSSPRQQQQSTASDPTRFAPSQQYPAPSTSTTPAAPTKSPPARPPTSRPIPPRPSAHERPKVSTNSPEYKQAAWKWTSAMVAMPILLVTSYFLFDRCAYRLPPYHPFRLPTPEADFPTSSGLGKQSEPREDPRADSERHNRPGHVS